MPAARRPQPDAHLIAPDDREALLTLARRVLDARVRRQPLPDPPEGGVFDLPCGAFVTIHRDGALRGCLGSLELSALSETIAHLAAVVSDSDPRFEPVRLEEVDDIDIEISVLTPDREVATIDEIEIGRHGLIVEQGHRRGLLLPQVATEHGWSVMTFVEHTCLKAGLPRDAWKKGARLKVFEAEVFGERRGRRV
jgi:AmmeMemoRadiSam system protein A